MRVVILKDTELGKRGELVEVKDGYGRNYLIPQNIACEISDFRAKEALSEQGKKAKEVKEKKELAEEKVKEVADKEIIFKVKVNKTGKPYKAINLEEIAKKMGVPVKQIDGKPLKTLGEHLVKVKSGENVVESKVILEEEKS